jgi:hypothetical protein
MWRSVFLLVGLFFCALLLAEEGTSSAEAQERPAIQSINATAATMEDGFQKLFDGETLEGWEGNQDMFRVRDQAIVGGSLEQDVPRNEFLCTTKKFADFELRLEFKILGEGANAGVQFRSQRIPNHHEVIGYQADLGDQWWGCLYDESRRRKVLAGPVESKRGDPVKRNTWNEYRIRCQGEHIQLWINGTQTVDYRETDADIARTGIIGLQVHSGGPMEAWYRNIRIRQLK